MASFRNLLGLPVKKWDDRKAKQVLQVSDDLEHFDLADQSGGGGGSGIHIDDRVATYASLPSPPTEGTGATYLVDADGLIYVWDGSAWPAQGAGLAISSGGQSGVTTALLHMDGVDGSTDFPNAAGYGDGAASGGAVVSTARSKFGGSSLLIGPANNSGLTLPASQLWGLHRDFWLECFVFIDSSISPSGGDGLRMFFSTRPLSGGSNASSYLLGFTASGGAYRLSLSGYSASADGWSLPDPPTVATDTWLHMGVGIRSGILRVFVDGVCVDVVVLPPIAEIANEAHVGFMTPTPTGGSRSLCGSIDELRIISGATPHWDDFTPPAAPYPNPI